MQQTLATLSDISINCPNFYLLLVIIIDLYQKIRVRNHHL